VGISENAGKDEITKELKVHLKSQRFSVAGKKTPRQKNKKLWLGREMRSVHGKNRKKGHNGMERKRKPKAETRKKGVWTAVFDESDRGNEINHG